MRGKGAKRPSGQPAGSAKRARGSGPSTAPADTPSTSTAPAATPSGRVRVARPRAPPTVTPTGTRKTGARPNTRAPPPVAPPGARKTGARPNKRAPPPVAPPAEETLCLSADEANSPGPGETFQNFVDFGDLCHARVDAPSPRHAQGGAPSQGALSQSNIRPTAVTTANSMHPNPTPVGIMPEVNALWCAGDDVYVHVPLSLREQVRRGDYINLALLLKGAIELAEICNGNTLCMNAAGQIVPKSKECKDKVQSIEMWTDAFIIYMAIYLDRYPEKAVEMLRYMNLIREAARGRPGWCWRAYDEQFRVRQAAAPSSWANINADLWLRCMSLNQADTSQTRGRTLTCDLFNNGDCNWRSCKYAHKCSKCGLGHRRLNCPSEPKPRLDDFRPRQPFGRGYNQSQFRTGSGAFGRGARFPDRRPFTK